jgi:transposase
MRLSLQGLEGLDQQLGQFLGSLKAMRQAIDDRIQALVKADQQLARKQALLTTVPAVGAMGAASMAALFARVPFKRSDSVVGLDVRASDSGTYRGRRKLTKLGPAYLRRQVWLMGFAACHTKIYKPFYEAMKMRGLKSTEAIMILGRRILRIAWAVWRTDKPFEPQLVGKRA